MKQIKVSSAYDDLMDFDVYDGVLWCLWWCIFVLSFFSRGVLDGILNLIESVSEGFPSYFWCCQGVGVPFP